MVSMVLLLLFSMSSVVSAQGNENELHKEALYERLGYTKEYIANLDSYPESVFIGAGELNAKSMTVDNKDIKNAIEFGFTEQEIADFTEIDWSYIENKNADLVSVEERYIAITADGQAQEFTKEEAFREIATFAVDIGTDTKTTSWMKAITTVSKDTSQSPTAYYLKHSFEWLTQPVWTLQDGIAISHPEYMAQIQNSEIFKYTFDYHTNDVTQRYVGTIDEYKMTADNKNSNGMAFKFDIKGKYYGNNNIDYVVKKNRGYMIFGTTRASSQYTKGTAYGHYGHSEIAIAVSIGVKVSLNNLAISGATKVTTMTDTGVTFNF